jgi:hypothetical protein
MNNNFKKLKDTYYDEWRQVSMCDSLEHIQDKYTNLLTTRIEIYDAIASQPEETQQNYVAEISTLEDQLLCETGDVPTFDTQFNPHESFEEYEGYYQRYGCQDAYGIISWDEQNVLVYDGGENIDMIVRPDVLMAS